METETIRVNDVPFAELGRVVHEGRTFDAGGAHEIEGRLFCYHTGNVVTSWDGAVTFGRVVRANDYRGTFGRMRSLRVRRPDGSIWFGRYGYDWRSCVTLRRAG